MSPTQRNETVTHQHELVVGIYVHFNGSMDMVETHSVTLVYIHLTVVLKLPVNIFVAIECICPLEPVLA